MFTQLYGNPTGATLNFADAKFGMVCGEWFKTTDSNIIEIYDQITWQLQASKDCYTSILCKK